MGVKSSSRSINAFLASYVWLRRIETKGPCYYRCNCIERIISQVLPLSPFALTDGVFFLLQGYQLWAQRETSLLGAP